MGMTQILMKQTDPKLTGFRVGFKWFPPTLSGADSAIGHALDMGWGEPIIRDWIVNEFATIEPTQVDRLRRFKDITPLKHPPPGFKTAADVVIENARRALSDLSNNCARVLKWAGLHDALVKKLPDTKFLSVTADGDQPAKNYFSDAEGPMETLSALYSRVHPKTLGGGISNRLIIVTYYGANSFLTGSNDPRSSSHPQVLGFFLHELTHHATGYSDDDLASRLLAPRADGDARTSSQRLDEFFNGGCDFALAAPPPLPKRR